MWSPGSSCPVPPVRTARGRLVRVARTYSPTCQPSEPLRVGGGDEVPHELEVQEGRPVVAQVVQLVLRELQAHHGRRRRVERAVPVRARAAVAVRAVLPAAALSELVEVALHERGRRVPRGRTLGRREDRLDAAAAARRHAQGRQRLGSTASRQQIVFFVCRACSAVCWPVLAQRARALPVLRD
eukprot:scaffold9521_cov50-Phaeocystis_antarctica.AAC.1